MALLFALGSGIALLAFPDAFFFRRASTVNTSVHLANAGVQEALAKINNGSITSATTFLSRANIIPAAYGSYSVTVTPLNTGDGGLSAFSIVSTATLNSKPQVIKQITAVAQAFSYARYQIFGGSTTASQSSAFDLSNRVAGMVYSNGSITLPGHAAITAGGGGPIFSSSVNTAGSLDWGSDTAPETAEEWSHLASEGQAAFRAGAPVIPFPSATSSQFSTQFSTQQSIALGGGAAPTSDGVYLPGGGGIYARGSFRNVTFSINGSNNQVISFQKSSSQTATITLDSSGNRTVFTDFSGAVSTVSGLPKPIIYCEGRIGSDVATGLSGTVKWQGSLYCQDRIIIINSIVADIDGNGTLDSTDGKLSLISPSIRIGYKNTFPAVVNIQSSLMSTASEVQMGDYEFPTGVTGAVHIVGSMSQAYQLRESIFGQPHDHSSPCYIDYQTDPRLGASPSPYFPSLNKFNLSWLKITR